MENVNILKTAGQKELDSFSFVPQSKFSVQHRLDKIKKKDDNDVK